VDQYQGVPPYRETRNYVRQVITDFNRKKVAQQKAATAPAKKSSKPPRKSPAKSDSTVAESSTRHP
jgi:hypothetical protein